MADVSNLLLFGKDDETTNPTDMLELKQRLDCELHNLEVAKLTDDQSADETTVADLKARISALNEELMEKSTRVSLRNLFIKKLELSGISEEHLTAALESNKESSFVSARIEDLEIASEIMRIHKEIFELEKTYVNGKRTNLELKEDNMKLIQRLKEHKVKAKSVSSDVKQHPEYSKLIAELDVKTMSVDINKNLITQIAIGAGMNWDSDECLHNIISNGEIN